MKLSSKKFVTFGALFLVALFVVTGCTPKEEEAPEEVTKKKVSVQTIALQNEVVSSLNVSGTIVPRQYSSVRSLVQGTVEYVVPVGTKVSAGTSLFRIRDAAVESAYQNALQNLQNTETSVNDRISQAELGLSSAEARAALAEKNLASATKQATQTLRNAQDSAIVTYGSAYNTLSQLLNFLSDGSISNFDYRYKDVVTAESELREQGDLQFNTAAQVFISLPSPATVTNETLSSSLEQINSALSKAKLVTDTSSVLLQNALGGVSNITVEQNTLTSYQTQINTQSAAVLGAQNSLTNAEITSDLSVEQAQNSLELAQIELRNATIGLENAKTSAQLERTAAQSQFDGAAYNFSNLAITSPFAGTVISTSVEAGQQVSVGQEIIELGNLDIVEVEVDVDADFGNSLKVGDLVTINSTNEGIITEIEPAGSLSSGKIGVTVQASNADADLVAGNVADVQFDLTFAQDGLIVIPINSATIEANDTYVFVIKDGIATRQSVTLGQIFGNRVSVSTGLVEGDQLILRNGVFIAEGDEVEIAQ